MIPFTSKVSIRYYFLLYSFTAIFFRFVIFTAKTCCKKVFSTSCQFSFCPVKSLQYFSSVGCKHAPIQCGYMNIDIFSQILVPVWRHLDLRDKSDKAHKAKLTGPTNSTAHVLYSHVLYIKFCCCLYKFT